MPGADPNEYDIRLGLWLAARRKHPHPGGTTLVTAEPRDRTSSAYTIAESDVAAALAELKRLRADIEEVAGDRNGHRDRQIWAERVLAVLLAREGGATEVTPAKLTRADLNGSFVSSRDVATGNERIEFRASRRRRAAPQQPERGGGPADA